ncbi:hypothetical protein [Desulfovirgula thermocuniculi]|uniref:hypothetical protein n=1 Tax=Desulfovirgula thermocuniculi TaxID=348842 RepID=UPI0003F87741|nr:hypothetical protein [Desulfovirgula thermocuniculi]
MREILVQIAYRLGEAPNKAAELTLRRGEINDQLHKALDALKETEARVAGEVAAERNGDGRPLYPNEQARQAEIARRLAADQDYQALRQEADRLRQVLREIDARIEETGRRHRSDCQMASLVAAMLNAGLREEALAVLGAYAEGLKAGQGEKPGEGQGTQGQDDTQNAQGQDGAQGLAEGTFKVLEARANDKGVVRAWCEGPQGKVALFAKNGAAKILQAAVGKRVKAHYRALDKGLFAVAVEVVA